MEYIAMVMVSLVHLLHFYETRSTTAEERLLSQILSNHSSLIRPVTNKTQPVLAKFGIEIIQIIKVDDRNQLLTTKVWVRQSWTNELLTWSPEQWEGITYLKVQPHQVWIPDVLLYDNAADEHPGSVEKYKTQIIVYDNGLHFWLSPAIFTSSCKIDIRFFPFDNQVCSLKFGSWTHDMRGINLTTDARDVITSQFVQSTEWHVTKVEKQANVIHYGCCPHPYGDVTFKIFLRRKSLFYVFNVIAPCLVLSLTLLFGFFFPPESGERISFTITVLLAIAVFMQMISSTLPVNSDTIPKLALFYMVILIESTLSLGTTSVVLLLHHRSWAKDVGSMSPWVRKYFIHILARKMGYLKPSLSSISTNKILPSKDENGEFYKEYKKQQMYETMSNKKIRDLKSSKLKSRKNHALLKHPKEGKKLMLLGRLQRDVSQLVAGKTKTHLIKKKLEEWRLFAKVLDRLFFGVFLLTVTVSTVAILGPAYYHQN